MTSVVYVCYNLVSYTVACEHALQRNAKSCTVLYAQDRIEMQARYQSIRHRPLTRTQAVMTLLLVCLSRPAVVYLPHHRTGRLIALLGRVATSMGLVDDGLDTLRDMPKNIDREQLSKVDELLSFSDYERFGAWTAQLRRTPVCPLACLGHDGRPVLDTGAADALVIQSPGVDFTDPRLIEFLADRRVLVLVHGNPAKRAAIPPDYAQRAAGECSIERTVEQFTGEIVSGETMVSVFILHCRGASGVMFCLTEDQFSNLSSLHERLARSRARILIGDT